MAIAVDGQHGFLDTNGVRLHYVSQGQGPLMLFLHGFPEFWYSWRHQLDYFAAHYTCVAIDLRGYNDSDKPDGIEAYRLENLVEDVRGAMVGGQNQEFAILQASGDDVDRAAPHPTLAR